MQSLGWEELIFYFFGSQQPKESVHVNGERMENDSDEEESEEDDTEDEEEVSTEDGAKTSPDEYRTASVAQVEIHPKTLLIKNMS